MSYTVSFDRLGRSNVVRSFVAEATTPDGVAAEVHAFARDHLASKNYEVVVDLDQLRGWVDGGRLGTFRLRPGVAEFVKTEEAPPEVRPFERGTAS